MTKKPVFDYLSRAESFLDPSREDANRPHDARAVIIPFGLEATVTYGHGTAKGPAAILAASQQIELFDEELWREPYKDYGIATLREPVIQTPVAAALAQLSRLVEAVLDAGKFPFVLGGEHSLTAGAINPFAAAYRDVTVLQLDAHPDLRDSYGGERLSHGSAMRRVLDHDHVRIVSVGIRSISAEEIQFLKENPHRVQMHFAKDKGRWDIDKIVAPLKGRRVYVTFDIDALDSAIMPATGTPTPDGLSYAQALDILRAAAEVSTIVGADLVELAPIAGLHACDYTAAHLAYKMMSYALSGTRPRSVS
jgi:agmatinase